MSTVKLRELLAPPGLVEGRGTGLAGSLRGAAGSLGGGHPFSEALGRAAAGEAALWRVPVAPGVALVNLGAAGAAAPGLLCCCLSPERGGGGGGTSPRAAWVVWGLARPSVNLFLGPALAAASATLDGVPDIDAMLEMMESKSFREKKIETCVHVEDVLEPLSYRIYPDTPVGEIQHLLLRRSVEMVPVVGEQRELLGVITAADVLARVLRGAEGGARSRRGLAARDLMRRSVLCVSEDLDLAEAARSLISRGLPRLPVVRAGELVGFLARETVISAFAEAFVTPKSPERVDFS